MAVPIGGAVARAFGVALGLFEDVLWVNGDFFGFDDSQELAFDEERVIGRALAVGNSATAWRERDEGSATSDQRTRCQGGLQARSRLSMRSRRVFHSASFMNQGLARFSLGFIANWSGE